MTDETNQQSSQETPTNAQLEVESTLDFAVLAAANIAEVAKLSGSPEGIAQALVALQAKIAELESIVKAPETTALVNEGEEMVSAIPASWASEVSQLVQHAKNALGFRPAPVAPAAKPE
jgi:uncharacterized protein (DUF885 family)